MNQTTWLLLHGTPLTPAVWDDVGPLLAGAGEVATPDLAHRPGARFDQGWHARQALEQAPTGQLDVVGHSFGGQVALEVALAAPSRVRSLTIICSRDTPFPAFAGTAAALRSSGTVDAEATLARWFTAGELAGAGACVEYARGCLLAVDPRSWADDLDAIASFDRSTSVPALTMPITLVAARHDQVATVEVMTAIARRVRHCRLHVVDGSHMSPFVDPQRLVELLLHSAGVH